MSILKYLNRYITVITTVTVLFTVTVFFTACKSVPVYQRSLLMQPQMQQHSIQSPFTQYVQTIREGSNFPGGDKIAGGCGCN